MLEVEQTQDLIFYPDEELSNVLFEAGTYLDINVDFMHWLFEIAVISVRRDFNFFVFKISTRENVCIE